MWENKYRKAFIWNCIFLLALVLVVVGFAIGYRAVTKQIEAEDKELSAVNQVQRQEQSEQRQENVDSVLQAYDQDMQTVAEYLPGIVCWGDSLTTGSAGNSSYPYTLQQYINAFICDRYDFRSTFTEGVADNSRLIWEDYKVSVPVVNLGSGQEDSNTVLGRAGVVPYVTKSDFVIPADTSSVTVAIVSSNGGRGVTPLTAGNAGVNPVTIAGVEGTLVLETANGAWGASQYTFTRLEAGAETTVPAGTEIVTACSQQYKDYIHVVWLGNYGWFTNTKQMVADVRQLLARQTNNTDRYVVLGPCTTGGNWGSSNLTTLESIDSAMLQAFGTHYISVRQYLITDGLRDAKVTLSRDDTLLVKQGFVPSVFRSTAGGADLNGAAYEMVGKLVYDRMDRLGYFDEVREELKIEADNILTRGQ